MPSRHARCTKVRSGCYLQTCLWCFRTSHHCTARLLLGANAGNPHASTYMHSVPECGIPASSFRAASGDAEHHTTALRVLWSQWGSNVDCSHAPGAWSVYHQGTRGRADADRSHAPGACRVYHIPLSMNTHKVALCLFLAPFPPKMFVAHFSVVHAQICAPCSRSLCCRASTSAAPIAPATSPSQPPPTAPSSTP